MKIIRSARAMQKWALAERAKGRKIGFVPTMGYLHTGHLSLIDAARDEGADRVVVSIFVNPIQFNNARDLSRYPRDEKRDLQQLQKKKVNVVFLPTVKEMYPKGHQSFVEVERLTDSLCGAQRPGHFRGVTTIVAKLFNIVQPDIAVFGKKDYQQWLVITQMVKDLNFPVRVVGASLYRDPDGLAMSSRNARLKPKQRALALSIHRGLEAVSLAAKDRALTAENVREIFLAQLPKNRNLRVEYVECADAKTLVPLSLTSRGNTLVSVAVFVGNVRLIDNIQF